MPTVETVITQEVQLKPEIKARLLRELRAFAALKTQIAVLEMQLDAHKAAVRAAQEQAGVDSLKVEGFTVSNVANIRSDALRFRMRLMEMGVTADMLDEAKASSLRPGKPYERITLPSEKESE